MSADMRRPIEGERQSSLGLWSPWLCHQRWKRHTRPQTTSSHQAPSGFTHKVQATAASPRGASGLALASEVIADYQALDDANQRFLTRWRGL